MPAIARSCPASLSDVATNAERAKEAIEKVCAGELDRMQDFYSPNFHDRVNTMEFHGYEGARESVSLYRRLFADLRFVVDQQVSEGDLVASRWTLTGTNRGRPVKLTGNTISRFEDGLVVDDWGSTDSIELVRQLGIWRTLLMVATEWRFLLKLTRG
jgi:predicted ester cyclase